MVPTIPGGTVSDASRTSSAFSPKMARSRRSSGVSTVSPLGVTFPTRMSPGLTSAPMRTMPLSSRSFSASSPTLGMSRVISSLPSLVSRASISNSSMWIEVYRSSFTSRSLIRMASSKLYPPQGMNATRTFWPSANSPCWVAGPSAITWPRTTRSPLTTMGFWLMQVFWLLRRNFIRL